MKPWQEEAEAALSDFWTVARLAGYEVGPDDFEVEFHDAPHRPPRSMPGSKLARYGFHGRGGWPKLGISGNQSQGRYTSRHCNASSAPSTVAASLLREEGIVDRPEFLPTAPGHWIR